MALSYAGYTVDLERRYKEHEKGTRKCRYTRSFPPKKIAASWMLETKSVALRVESAIKKLSRIQKEKVVGVDVYTLIQILKLTIDN